MGPVDLVTLSEGLKEGNAVHVPFVLGYHADAPSRRDVHRETLLLNERLLLDQTTHVVYKEFVFVLQRSRLPGQT